MAIPDQTLELTNSQHMPPVSSLTGQELIPAASSGLQKLPVSLTPTDMGDYVLGLYTNALPDYPVGAATPASTLLLAEGGQTYKITIADVTTLATANITLTGSGLAFITDNGPANKNISVPIATLQECDDAVRNDVAVTPAGLANYKMRLAVLEAQMAQLLYVPIAINSFTSSPNTVEIGSSVASVVLNWNVNKPATNQTMSNYSGTLQPTDNNATVTGPFSSDRSWTLTVTDGQTTVSSTASLAFRNKRYWGVSPNTTLSNSEIIALSSEFSTSRVKDITYNASVGSGANYIYYAYPTSFGTLSAVTVGGLAFSDFTTTIVNFVNASGYTAQYNLVRINNIQTGSNIMVHWA